MIVHTGLLLFTFVTTTLAGVQWLNKDPFEISNFALGLPYGLLLISFLGSHELGHYFTARHYGVDVSLPYFIPLPSFLGIAPFGTLGAVIRIRSIVRSRQALFDIGAAGPLCGFAVSLITLIIGFLTLPPQDYLYGIHPEYSQLAVLPKGGLTFGSNLLFNVLKAIIPSTNSFIPPMNEIYHYPYICVGWFGLFVTALNLIPVGQLDGGHIARALFTRHHNRIGQASLIILASLGTLGILPLLGSKIELGWIGWLIWGIILAVILRARPQGIPDQQEPDSIGGVRLFVGWICIVILISSFIPIPFFEPA